MDEYTWHDVIKECEQVLGCEYSAESPLMCNLPNLIRDLQFKLEKADKRHLTSRSSRAADVCAHCGQPIAMKTVVCAADGNGHVSPPQGK